MKRIQLLFAAVLFMAAMALTSCGNSKECKEKCDGDKTECDGKKCDENCEKPCCKEGEEEAHVCGDDCAEGCTHHAGEEAHTCGVECKTDAGCLHKAVDKAVDETTDAVKGAATDVKDAAIDAVTK